ncbi:hypothetical protein MPSEU_000397300 [Mayamaea pseudoterrestris]|nr:hypothetical protein MPSEU_000397300 [Mayamaea pseudoterrestris]
MTLTMTMNRPFHLIAMLLLFATPFTTFAFAPSNTASHQQHHHKTTTLCMTNNLFRAARSAGADDNVVELMRPLGLILKQDEETGNVYVDKVAPKGNAARTGKVKEGDIVAMCSATFGDEMWSTRGVGLTRVLAAIRVRSGPTVKLVFESPKQLAKKRDVTAQQIKQREDAAKAAQERKDKLLLELQDTETKIKKGKFLGLF